MKDTLTINVAARTVYRAGYFVPLTAKEFDLLVVLAEKPGTVITRAEIFKRVWGYEALNGMKTLDMHMSTLRNKLAFEVTGSPIVTVRGVGFRFDVGNDLDLTVTGSDFDSRAISAELAYIRGQYADLQEMHGELLNRIFACAPECWDGDTAAEELAAQFVESLVSANPTDMPGHRDDCTCFE